MNEHDQTHSPAVREILDRPPKWLTLWGYGLYMAVLLLMLCISWWMQIPDTTRISGRVQHFGGNILSIVTPLDVNNTFKIQTGQKVLMEYHKPGDTTPLVLHGSVLQANTENGSVTIQIELIAKDDIDLTWAENTEVALLITTGHERLLMKVIRKMGG